MKILCLHGFGSSGKILEDQADKLIKALDPTYEFVFVDGPEDANRGPGELNDPSLVKILSKFLIKI